MNENQLKYFLNRHVRIILKNGFHYTGCLEFVGQETIRIKDKFGNPVVIDMDTVILIEGVR